MRSVFSFCFLLLAISFLTGCASTGSISSADLAALRAQIAAEPPGNYFVGRRYYKHDYKFWGYIRSPGQPWTSAQLVMLNEQRKLAPDRAAWNIGSDNGYEYRLNGHFSGDTVYEPASNSFYPEFVLTDATLITSTPLNIFNSPEALNPNKRVILKPSW